MKIPFKYSQKRNCAASVPLPAVHSCVCEPFIYSQDLSTYVAAAKQADRSRKYINLSQIHECRNWETDHYNSVLERTTQAAQFYFWEYINRNQTLIMDSHLPFICSTFPVRKQDFVRRNYLLISQFVLEPKNPKRNKTKRNSKFYFFILIMQITLNSRNLC